MNLVCIVVMSKENEPRVIPPSAGGMGEVYKAVDDSLERAVALKVLPPELTANDERASSEE